MRNALGSSRAGRALWRPSSPRISACVGHDLGTPSSSCNVLLGFPAMFAFAVMFAAAPLAIATYAYVGYPLLLLIGARLRPRRIDTREGGTWPAVTITVPVYNAAARIRGTLERLLELDYPRDRLQVLVIS